MTNFRIVPNPNDPQHSMIVCDVTYDEEKIDGPTGGFSFSALVGGESLSQNPDCCLYLPFPLYQDRELIDRLLKSYPDMAVGKWKKKSAEMGLLCALLVFLAKPLWETVYKQCFEQSVVDLIGKLKGELPDDMEIDFVVEIPVSIYQPRPKVIFLPARESVQDMNAVTKLPDGLEAAKAYCERDYFMMAKRISRLRMTFDPASGCYVVLDVQYIDGTHRHFA